MHTHEKLKPTSLCARSNQTLEQAAGICWWTFAELNRDHWTALEIPSSVPSSFLFLVVMRGATSSFLLLVAMHFAPSSLWTFAELN